MFRRFLLPVIVLLTISFTVCSFAEESAKSKKAKKSARSAKGQKKTAKKKGTKESKPALRQIARPVASPVVIEKPQLAPAQLTELKHWSTPDYTRIAVMLTHDAPFEKHEIANAPGSGVFNRVFFDINGAKLAPGVRDLSVGDGLLKSVRVAQYRPDTVRVVLDVENIKDYKIFTFSDPFRIIVDVKGERKTEISALTPSITAPMQAQVAAAKDVEFERPKAEAAVKIPQRPRIKPGKIRRIVVDPGHGGKDPGAVGLNGLQEKDVVLSIGRIVARKLKDELGIDAVMTRSTDVFVELQERTAIANQVGADLFISIHANASLNRKASGIETYYLNLAKTEKAAQLAERENVKSL